MPVGNRQASHWMYCSAEPMMMIANGVTIGHHCRSFQSVQKSQSPANNCLVMSAAAPTTKAAVTQNTRSHLRSMYRYFFLTSSRSSRVLASTATVTSPSTRNGVAAVRGAVRSESEGARRAAARRTPPTRLGGGFDGFDLLTASAEPSHLGRVRRRVFDFLLDAEQADRRLGPQGEDPHRDCDPEREEQVEHRDVGRGERGVTDRGLVPGAVLVGPEAGHDVQDHGGGADQAPEHRDP